MGGFMSALMMLFEKLPRQLLPQETGSVRAISSRTLSTHQYSLKCGSWLACESGGTGDTYTTCPPPSQPR
jgi:hypothetical protein